MELNEPQGAFGYLNEAAPQHLEVNSFEVFEVPRFIATGAGPHTWSLLEKNFSNTLDVVQEIAWKINVNIRDLGYAGLKDRKGKTLQWLSSPAPPPQKGNGWKILLSLQSQKKLKRGNLLGNWFIIKMKKNLKPFSLKMVPNFFGPQRFSKSNHIIGRHLIKGERKEALSLMRKQRIPFTRKYFVLMEDAYTSYLFNKVLSMRLKSPSLSGDLVGKRGVTGPVFGRKLPMPEGAAGEIEEKVLSEEGLTLRDFPGDGKRRPLFIEPKGFSIKKNQVKFFLPKGSYATIVLREISKEEGISWNVAHPTSSSSS